MRREKICKKTRWNGRRGWERQLLERRQVLITETEEGDGCEVVIHRSSI